MIFCMYKNLTNANLYLLIECLMRFQIGLFSFNRSNKNCDLTIFVFFSFILWFSLECSRSKCPQMAQHIYRYIDYKSVVYCQTYDFISFYFFVYYLSGSERIIWAFSQIQKSVIQLTHFAMRKTIRTLTN